ncbi:MAG: hypothetical protein JTT11_08050 [Candidatus Brockarchaeota archaeon]|nr:hypothetical protein [Candidatus Brockarchaeota archaeon]
MVPSPADVAFDFPLALVLFAVIISAVFFTRKMKNVWVNRKLIHLSSAPAVLVYMFAFKEPYTFFAFAVAFTLALLIPHLRSRELKWFQVKANLGEVYYTLSFSILSITMWEASRILAGTAMLFMSVGDSVTGIIRSRFVSERKKHWSGSLGMLLTCSAIGAATLGARGVVLSALATLAEFQPWVDDNLAVPFSTALANFLIA